MPQHLQGRDAGMRAGPETPYPLEGLARLRQAAYRLFSQSLLYPDEQRLETIGAVAEELIGQSEPWADFAFFPEWSRLLRSLASLRCQGPAAIQGEYTSNFQVNRAGIPCPIYESVYLADDPSTVARLLAQLEGEYAQVGLVTSASRREAPDHLAVQLEFMSLLCSREAELWEAEDLPQARQTLGRERGFLKAHLSRWLPEFSDRMAALSRDSMFTNAALAARAFVLHDGVLIDSLLARFENIEEAP